MANVYDVANFFIDWANKSEEEHMTNLWLNKLLFFAQGHHLAKFGKPLFADAIEAWEYGPVIPGIYQKYKVCGRNPIPTVDEDYSLSKFTREEQLLLADILRRYGSFTANALVSMTHSAGSPWSDVYTFRRNAEIPKDIIESYFKQSAHKLMSFSEILQQKNLSILSTRDKDGYLVLPNDGCENEDWDEL